MDASFLRRAFKNPFYAGLNKDVDDPTVLNKGTWEPMITEDEFNTIQKMLELKKKPNVKITIWTAPKTPLTSQDIQQFNTQYPTLTVNHTSKMHDRFLIIDNKILYHIGASLKDLGKKCFAFEILDKTLIPHLLANL